MIQCQEINQYIEFVKSHPTKVNKKRHLLIKNIVIPTLKRNDIYFDEETYHKCLAYCEKNFYKLFPYQKFIYAFVFMYEKETDFPVFRIFLIFMGRGNGKDGFIMPLINFLQTPIYGIANYNIDIVANNEDQAKDTFNVVYDMLDTHPKLKKLFDVTKEEITNKSTKARLKYNTSNAKTKDGKKDGALVFNEIHAYEDYEQIKVFTSGLGKIKHPRTFEITTNGNVRGGPLDDRLAESNQVLETGSNPTKIFPFLCELNSVEDWERESCWQLCNPSWDFMPILQDQIKQDYLKCKQNPSLINEFKSKRLNISIDAQEEVGIATWENIVRTTEIIDGEKRYPRPIPNIENEVCIGSVDFADIRDFVSAGLLFNVDGEDVFMQKTWICSRSPFFKNIKFPFDQYGQDGFTDFEIVDEDSIRPDYPVQWLYEKSKTYRIQKIVIDTYRARMLEAKFQEYGFDIESKENPFGMVRMIRRMGSIYALVVPEIEKGFSDGTINFCGSRIMRWFTRNTGVSTDKWGNKAIVKIEPKLRKNDGISAYINAKSQSKLLEETTIYI